VLAGLGLVAVLVPLFLVVATRGLISSNVAGGALAALLATVLLTRTAGDR
jgi:hypothetical protein